MVPHMELTMEKPKSQINSLGMGTAPGANQGET